jgi:ABC-type amino acid transport substrate-binding protein
MRLTSRAVAFAGALVLILAACGGSTPSPTNQPAATTAAVVPDAIKTAGKIVFCVDVSYPPEEFYAADGTTAQGSDVDFATEIASGSPSRSTTPASTASSRRSSPRSATPSSPA